MNILKELNSQIDKCLNNRRFNNNNQVKKEKQENTEIIKTNTNDNIIQNTLNSNVNFVPMQKNIDFNLKNFNLNKENKEKLQDLDRLLTERLIKLNPNNKELIQIDKVKLNKKQKNQLLIINEELNESGSTDKSNIKNYNTDFSEEKIIENNIKEINNLNMDNLIELELINHNKIIIPPISINLILENNINEQLSNKVIFENAGNNNDKNKNEDLVIYLK